MQWTFYTVPMKKGDPGLETWDNLDARAPRRRQSGFPASYDPETHLYIVGTGNPSPGLYQSGDARRRRQPVHLLAGRINVDTGKMAWYYQTSPHDTHDWDSTETPILIDGEFNGRPRKMVLQPAATATSTSSTA